jgi:hypothetical protein
LVLNDSVASDEGNSNTGHDSTSSLGSDLIILACRKALVSDTGSGRFVLTMSVSSRWSLVVGFGESPMSGCTIPIPGSPSSHTPEVSVDSRVRSVLIVNFARVLPVVGMEVGADLDGSIFGGGLEGSVG